MEENLQINIDEKKARRILMKLILIERENIKTKKLNDIEMVKKIKKMIEEEVECF